MSLVAGDHYVRLLKDLCECDRFPEFQDVEIVRFLDVFLLLLGDGDAECAPSSWGVMESRLLTRCLSALLCRHDMSQDVLKVGRQLVSAVVEGDVHRAVEYLLVECRGCPHRRMSTFRRAIPYSMLASIEV